MFNIPQNAVCSLVARARCCLMLSLLQTSTHRPLSAELLFSHLAPSLCVCPGAAPSIYSWCLFFLGYTSTASPGLVSSNLLKMNSAPASISPRCEPQETLLVTSCQPDAAPVTAMLWAVLFSLFIAHCSG